MKERDNRYVRERDNWYEGQRENEYVRERERASVCLHQREREKEFDLFENNATGHKQIAIG